MKNVAWLRYFTAFGLTLAIFVSSSMVVLGATEKNKLAGEIIISGNSGSIEKPAVTLNGERALSGYTFFSSGEISTSETSSATINLGKLGYVNLSPNSKLSLSFTENNISGNLSAGEIKVFAKEGVSVNIQTVNGIVNNDANQTGIFTINVESGSAKISTEEGSVFLKNGQSNIPQQGQQTTTGSASLLAPVLVFTGIVALAIIYPIVTDDDDDDVIVSPSR